MNPAAHRVRSNLDDDADKSGWPRAAECSRAGTDSDHTGRFIFTESRFDEREQGTPLGMLGIERGKESSAGSLARPCYRPRVGTVPPMSAWRPTPWPWVGVP